MTKSQATLMAKLVSIVIPAYNEEKNISKTLKSLAKQDIKSPYEIIVVDNASTDKTPDIAKSFAKKINIKVIKELHKSRGTARATGMAKARGEILFCADADTVYPSNWLSTGVKYFDNPKTVGITGPWHAFGVSSEIKKRIEKYQELGSVIPAKIFLGSIWLTGFNMAIRSTAYKKCGGFNPKINAYEDVDISLRLKKFGKLVYAKDFIAKTSARRFKKGMIKTMWEYDKLVLQKMFLGDKGVKLSDTR